MLRLVRPQGLIQRAAPGEIHASRTLEAPLPSFAIAYAGSRMMQVQQALDPIACIIQLTGDHLAAGRPLEPAVRAFMEARFDQDFSHVRIHTGSWAAATARALRARAFTLGPHIFFAAGRYDPVRPAGRQLLAHELVHVVQQGQSASEPAHYPLGSPDADEEDEAEHVAAQILTGQRVSRITSGSPRVIQRSIIPSLGTQKIIVSSGSAKPGLHSPTGVSPTGNRFQIWHLTNNFNAAAPELSGDAWNAVATISVLVDPGEQPNLKNWDFGFIQIMRLNVLNAFYAGRLPEHGGIALNLARFPGMASPLLDSASPVFPFTRKDTSGDKSVQMSPLQLDVGTATASTGDHPFTNLVAMLRNGRTGEDNFLFHTIDDREFWAVFTARNPAKRFDYLAHFHGKVRWEVRYVWRKFSPVGTIQSNSGLTLSPVRGGKPTHPAVQSLLQKPTGPMFNEQFNLAMVRGPNDMDNKAGVRIDTGVDERFGVVPPDFFL